MKYAIIAAGEGSRLSNEGVAVPKPLVQVGGEALIDRLIRIFMNNNASEIVVVCNGLTGFVAAHLEHLISEGLDGRRVPLRFVVRNTPSSMHSLHAMRDMLKDGPFVLTTVDTVFDENEFVGYVTAFSSGHEDGMMGVTGYIEDEKPLYVELSEDGRYITGFHDIPCGSGVISAGIYGLGPSAMRILDECVARGEMRMRNFQRALVAGGQRLAAYRFSKVLDIDHASDIKRAEEMLG